MRAAVGVPKAVVETGPGGGAMIYVPLSGADHADCAGVFDKGNAAQDLADKTDCAGNDVAVGFQKKLAADGWMGFAASYVENAADADAAAVAINTWAAARTPDKILADAKAEFEAWRKPPPDGILCSDDEKKLWRQGEAVLRMGQVREADSTSPIARKNHGMMLASLPIGEWHTGWVRDGTYAVVALARMGHLDEARLALDFFLNAFQMNPSGKGKYRNLVHNADYRISVVRYYGTGEEEADTNQDGPNVETDGWGLVLWAARQYVEASGPDGVAWLDKPTFSGSVWDTLTGGIATPIEAQLEQPSSIMGADSSIWEVHDAKKRHYGFTTLAAARGICDIAGIAKKANKSELAKYQDLAKKIREGFTRVVRRSAGRARRLDRGPQPGQVRRRRRRRGVQLEHPPGLDGRHREGHAQSPRQAQGRLRRLQAQRRRPQLVRQQRVDPRRPPHRQRAPARRPRQRRRRHRRARRLEGGRELLPPARAVQRHGGRRRDRRLHGLDPHGRLRRRRVRDHDARSLGHHRGERLRRRQGRSAPQGLVLGNLDEPHRRPGRRRRRRRR